MAGVFSSYKNGAQLTPQPVPSPPPTIGDVCGRASGLYDQLHAINAEIHQREGQLASLHEERQKIAIELQSMGHEINREILDRTAPYMPNQSTGSSGSVGGLRIG